jgi:hypothetical protein
LEPQPSFSATVSQNVTGPKLTVLGVYRPVISPETWQEQWQVTGNDEATREHFDKLVLIEAVVEGLSEPFDMGAFGRCGLSIQTIRN